MAKKRKQFKPDANQRLLCVVADGCDDPQSMQERLDKLMKGAGRPELVITCIVQCARSGWIKRDENKGYVITAAGKTELETMASRFDERQVENEAQQLAAREVKKIEAKKLRKSDMLDRADKLEREGEGSAADRLREQATSIAP